MEVVKKRVGAVAVIAAFAAVLASCASSSRPAQKPAAAPAAAPARVSLRLLGGAQPVRLRACGVLTSYPTYRFGGFVRYSGKVTPAPPAAWSVKVKLKRCIPHGYSESFFDIVAGRSDGSFSGLVPKLNPNEFYVRVEYRPSPGRLILSSPAYFRVVGHG